MSPQEQAAGILELAESGEPELASIEAIRIIASWGKELGDKNSESAAMQSAVLSDLGALRYAAGDFETATACLRAAVVLDEENYLAGANLAAAQESLASPPIADDMEAETEESVWIAEALATAQGDVGLSGKDVLEIGCAAPSAMVATLDARSWIASDAEGAHPTSSLPYADASFDVVMTTRALEQECEFHPLFSELHRVLRPGGQVFTQVGPIWSSAIGHEVWLHEATAGRVHRDHPVLPSWGHLLLNKTELACFLTLALGAGQGEEAAEALTEGDGLNRLGEAGYARVFAATPFSLKSIANWGGRCEPTPGLAAQLETAFPGGGDFGCNGIRAVLRKD